MIPIGGDDTLSYAATLHSLGVKVIAVPKTMDNDVRNTEYCIGFSTAVTRAMDAIERQHHCGFLMNESAFSVFSDATPGSLHCTPHTSRGSVAAFRSMR